MLAKDAVVVGFSTIPDSPVSPFHATINMRLSLVSRGLGRAYLAFCPKAERELLVRMLEKSAEPEDRPANLPAVVRGLVKTIRARGFAERNPSVEPISSSTVAVPIMADGRVLATLGITYFRSAVPRAKLLEQIVYPLKDAVLRVEQSITAMRIS